MHVDKFQNISKTEILKITARLLKHSNHMTIALERGVFYEMCFYFFVGGL